MNRRSAARFTVNAASTTCRSAEVPGLRVSDVTYRPRFATPLHTHDHDCATLVLEGAIEKELPGSERTLTVGAVAVTPAGVPHADRFGASGGRAVVVEVLVRADGSRPGLLPREPTGTRSPRLALLGRRLAAELRATDEAAGLALHSATLELLATLGRARLRAPRTPPAWLDDVTDYLHAHASERVTIGEVAAVAGVHRTHLARAFRARHGVSVGEYVRRLRVEWAADALLTSDSSIAEIAATAGFADQSHFTRTFARYVGVPPGRYRALETARET